MPYIGQGLEQGRRQLYTFTATASQTTFSASYTPGYVDVYQNGILLAPSDYTATNGTSVVLAVGAAVNDEITIIAQHLFSVADTVSASSGGTFSGDVTMAGNLTVQGSTITVDTATTQTVDLGDNDKIRLGDDNDLQIYHTGTTAYLDNNTGALYIRNNVDDDDGGNIIIEAKSGKASIVAQDDEGVRLYYDDVEKLETTATGVTVNGTVISDGLTVDTNTLHVDSSNNMVGIGTTSPATKLHIYSSVPDIRLEDTNTNAVVELRGNTGTGSFVIDTDVNNAVANSKIIFQVDNDEKVRIDANGDVGIGTTPYTNARLTIGGGDGGGYPAVLQFDNNNSSGAEFFMLATDTNWSAGSNKFIMGHGAPASSNTDVTIDSTGYVGINTTSPQRALHIHDHAATGLHITNSQSGSGANDGFSQYIRDDNQATELMVRENSYLGFGTNNTLRAKILSSGEFFWPEISNRGDLTFPICSISNNGSGGQYLHAQFQAQGGDMFHIHFRGYEYIGSSIREGSGGGYIYNTGGQTTAYAQAYNGHCVQVYQTTTNRVELVINTSTSQAGNRWGSYVFFGGTDTITSDSPLTLVQYGWNNSTGRLYSS